MTEKDKQIEELKEENKRLRYWKEQYNKIQIKLVKEKLWEKINKKRKNEN